MATERYFIRERSRKEIFRDDKGRFVSREEALRRNILPQVVESTTYRTKQGRFVSEEKVKRSKRRVVDVVRDKEGNLTAPIKIRGEFIEDPVFISILGQQGRSAIAEAIQGGDKIAFLWKGRLYQVPPERYGKLQMVWQELSNLAVDLFKEGDSLYYTLDFAEGEDAVLFDFDSIAPAEMDTKDENYKDLVKRFQAQANEIMKELL